MNAFDRDRMIRGLRQRAGQFTDPVLRQVLENAAKHREQTLRTQTERIGADAWPVLPTTQDGIGGGPLGIGDLPNGLPVRLTLDAFAGTTMVLGPPGSGKTTLALGLAEAMVQEGVWACWIDSKLPAGEPLRTALPVLAPNEAALSLEPPPGSGSDLWMSRLCGILEHSMYIADAVREIQQAYERLSRALPAGREPCLEDLRHVLEQWPSPRGTYRREQLVDTARSTLRRLCTGGHSIFTVTKMLAWIRRFSVPHAISLYSVPPDAARVFSLLLMHAYLEYRTHLGVADRRLGGIFFLDDARSLVRGLGRSAASGTDPAQWIDDLGNARGVARCFAIQNLAEIADDTLRSLTTLVLVGPIHGDDVRRLRSHLRLTDDQASYLQDQLPYHAVVWSSRIATYTYPFPVRLPGPEVLPALSVAADIQARGKARLLDGHAPDPWIAPQPAGLGANSASGSGLSKPAAAAPPRPPAVSPLAAQALRALSAEPWLYQEELGRRVGVNGRKLTDVRDELVQAGFIRPVTVGRAIAWEALPAAAAHLGTTFQQLPGRGGFAHRWLQARAAAWLRRTCRRVEVEFQLQSGGRLDVYGECPGGELLAIEIVLDLSYLDETIDKLRGFSGEPTLVAKDARARDAIRKAAGGASLWSTTAPVALTIAEFLKMSGT